MWWALTFAAAAPSVDEPLRTGARASADAAVVIGVEDYAFVEDVPYARRDAQAVATWLIYDRGVPQQHVERLTDASKEQVLAAVDRAKERVGSGGTLWVYWAGHGAASPDDGRRLLLGVDVMPEAEVFAARGVAVPELQERLVGVDSILWLDTCYSGAARGGGSLLKGTRLTVPAWALEPTSRTAVWTATKGREVSAGYDTSRHGLFTYVTLGALRGWADGELDGQRDGAVTAEEAQAYARRRIAELGGHTQTPQWLGPMDQVLAPEAPEAEPGEKVVLGVLSPSGGGVGTVGGGSLGSTGGGLSSGGSGYGTGGGTSSTRTAAQEKRAREARLKELSTPMRSEARQAFAAIEADATSGRKASEEVLTAYLDRWGEASVELDGQPVPVELKVVDRAQTLLDTYPDRRKQRAATVRMTIGAALLGGAAASGFLATTTRAMYEEKPLTAQPYNGLYQANRGAAYTAVGLGVVGSGFVLSGYFR